MDLWRLRGRGLYSILKLQGEPCTKVPLVLGLLPLTALDAQQTLIIEESRLCEDCRVAVAEVAVLESMDTPGGGVVASPLTFTSDQKGRFFTTSFRAGSEIRVFHPDGTFDQVVGQKGKGPGEFTYVTLVRPGAGDSIWAFDMNWRATVLTPDLEYARTFQRPGQVHDGFVLPDGSWIVNMDHPVQERRGLPLHHLSREGDLSLSFGSEDREYIPSPPYMMMRSVAPSGDSCVWSVPRTKYEVEKWCLDGTLEKRLRRKAIWFEPYVRRNPINRFSPFQPWIVGVQEDAEGLLWVLIMVHSPEWSDLWEDDMARGGLPSKLFDTQVEVVDPETGRLLLSEMIPHPANGFVGDGRFYSYQEDEFGQPSISVFSLDLNNSGSVNGR